MVSASAGRHVTTAILTFVLLTAGLAGCSAAQVPFGCEQTAARGVRQGAGNVFAAAATGQITCPTDLDEAADPEAASWAAHRIAAINAAIASNPDRYPAHRTYGELYDDDGTALWLESNQQDAHYELATKYTRPLTLAWKQAAGHVEPKAASVVRESGEDQAVLVINQAMCTYSGGTGCAGMMERILAEDTDVTVWSPTGRVEIPGRAER